MSRKDRARRASPSLIAKIRDLADQGMTDQIIAEETRVSREWVGQVRRAHGIPAVRHRQEAWTKNPVPIEALQRSWDLAMAVHRAGPVMGVCRGCRIFRPLTDGRVPLHYRQGRPCTGSHQRPMPHREEP